MEKIVTRPLKVDFHIHSEYSITKDEFKLVGKGTTDNLNTLFNKLNEYGVNMACITDHDFFSYEMYSAFKAYEGKGSLIKVLPGVEFSVGIEDDKKKIKQVHVIAIFDDSNQEKLKNIEKTVLKKVNDRVNYDNVKDQLFSESKMIEIFKNIGLNLVLIAHQKNSVSSDKAQKCDLKSIGEKKFNEFINAEVFEALEFKTMKSGLFNNLFAHKINAENNYDIVKFITGSDCHQWEHYPAHDESEVDFIDDFHHTYLKCLPTFKGITMALSDFSRIQIGDSFFSPDNSKINNICIEIDNKTYDIPISPGINAIIGDNSIGKSMLLHKLTNYNYLDDNRIQNGYNEYLDKQHIKILNSISDDDLYFFDKQGSVRKRFEDNTEEKNQEFLNKKFPSEPDKNNFVPIINSQFSKLYSLLQNKIEYDDLYSNLKTLTMIDKDVKAKIITPKKIVTEKTKMDNYDAITKYIQTIINAINIQQKHDDFDEQDFNILEEFNNKLVEIKNKYNNYHDQQKRIYNVKTGINQGIADYNNDMKLFKSQDEATVEQFENDCDSVSSVISSLVKRKREIKAFAFDNTIDVKVNPNVEKYNDYSFVKRFKNVKEINEEYLNSILKTCLKKNKIIDINTITKKELTEIIKDYNDLSINPVEFLKTKIDEKINDDFIVKNAIVKGGHDYYETLSSGLNSTMYFDIISGDDKRGIYIIDQPEDDVSQNAIKTHLIKDFKLMATKRQIILVTHNPQFVVNLDVDNVICIHKDDKGKIKISSGALEFEDKTVNENIIQIVADNLDGGVESIKKRWKRYGKETRISKE